MTILVPLHFFTMFFHVFGHACELSWINGIYTTTQMFGIDKICLLCSFIW